MPISSALFHYYIVGYVVDNQGYPYDRCLAYLINLFNVCFMDGYIPDAWSRGIICPIIKDTKKKITGIH